MTMKLLTNRQPVSQPSKPASAMPTTSPEDAGKTIRASSELLNDTALEVKPVTPETQDEEMVADARSELTPSQMVDRKLAFQLGVKCAEPSSKAPENQDVRRMSGSREGAGPAQPTESASPPGEESGN